MEVGGRRNKRPMQNLSQVREWEWRGSSFLFGTRSWPEHHSLVFQMGVLHHLAPPASLDGSCTLLYYAPLTVPPSTLKKPAHGQCALPLLMWFPRPAMFFSPQRVQANSYSSFKAQVKCHFPCDTFRYCPRLLPFPLCSRRLGTHICYSSHCTECVSVSATKW